VVNTVAAEGLVIGARRSRFGTMPGTVRAIN
jgi:hypothetical protein